MKNYKLILMDKDNNELTTMLLTCFNKKEAIEYTRILKATTKINDLKKIIIKKF